MTFRYNGLAGQSAPVALPTVTVIEPDPVARGALGVVIEASGWRAVLAGTAEEVVLEPAPAMPSCLICELSLPGRSGLDLQRQAASLEVPMIFMSERADPHAIVRAMKGGAFEFLTKPLALDVLPAIVADALDRSRALLQRRERVIALQERYESLSRREREVMSLVVAGRLNKQVGGDLGISEITVKAHRGKMMRKMRAASFAELVGMAATLQT